MDTRDLYKLVRELSEDRDDVINLYDSMDIELSEGFVIETGVVGFTEDGVIVHLDEDAMEFLDFNGVLLESEENLNEDEGTSDAVYDAVINRITRQHLDLLSKFGPAAVMAAVEEVADQVGDTDEIGSSDVSIWTRQVVQDLEAGRYKNLHENLNEDEGTSDAVCDAILNRIARQHSDVLQKFGPQAVMDAAEDLAQNYDNLDEIGSSDVSIWTKQVIQDLEAGMYKHLHENTGGGVEEFKAKISTSDDPFDLVYDAISGKHGETIRAAMQDMYDDIVIDFGLHPDDDFEKVIEKMLDYLDADSVMKEDEQLDELSDIKRLAGQEEVDEGLGKALLGGAALIAAVTGLSKMEAHRMMTSEPQLIALAQMRQEAEQKGDEYKVKELDDRIEKTMSHIGITGRPVMGGDGKPIDPRKPWAGESVQEAEYQGRKVSLGKPMQGDVAKSKVYVKNAKGNVVKVNFGDKNMTIKKNNPARRKSFRARHNCENPGPKWKARYWSCRAW